MIRSHGQTILYAAIMLTAGVACYLLAGPDAALSAGSQGLLLLVEIVPLLLAAVLIGSYFQALVPHAVVTRWLGAESGLQGLLIASGVGALTPGGPFTSFPLAVALYNAGADIGTTVAFITAWAVLGVVRFLIWELPLLGPELSLVRYIASLPLALIAGLIARWLSRHLGTGVRAGP